MEVAVLFVVGWRFEAGGGGRAWIVPQDTIWWLSERLGNIELFAPHYGERYSTHFGTVAQRMDKARLADHSLRNTGIVTGLRNKAPHGCIWVSIGTGLVKLEFGGGRRIFVGPTGRWNILNEETGELARLNYNYENFEDYNSRPLRRALRRRRGDFEEYDEDAYSLPRQRYRAGRGYNYIKNDNNMSQG